jgi:hypothetical protein
MKIHFRVFRDFMACSQETAALNRRQMSTESADQHRAAMLREAMATLGFSERPEPWGKVREAILGKALVAFSGTTTAAVTVSNRFSTYRDNKEILFWEAAGEAIRVARKAKLLPPRSTFVGLVTGSEMTLGPVWPEAIDCSYKWYGGGYWVEEFGGMVIVRLCGPRTKKAGNAMPFGVPDDRISAAPGDLSAFILNSLAAIRECQEEADHLSLAEKEGGNAAWQIARERLEPCDPCHGEGWNDSDQSLCSACMGSGLVGVLPIRRFLDPKVPGGIRVELLPRTGPPVIISQDEFEFGLQGCRKIRVAEEFKPDFEAAGVKFPIRNPLHSQIGGIRPLPYPGKRTSIQAWVAFGRSFPSLLLLALVPNAICLGIGYLICRLLSLGFSSILFLVFGVMTVMVAVIIRDRHFLKNRRNRKPAP